MKKLNSRNILRLKNASNLGFFFTGNQLRERKKFLFAPRARNKKKPEQEPRTGRTRIIAADRSK